MQSSIYLGIIYLDEVQDIRMIEDLGERTKLNCWKCRFRIDIRKFHPWFTLLNDVKNHHEKLRIVSMFISKLSQRLQALKQIMDKKDFGSLQVTYRFLPWYPLFKDIFTE